MFTENNNQETQEQSIDENIADIKAALDDIEDDDLDGSPSEEEFAASMSGADNAAKIIAQGLAKSDEIEKKDVEIAELNDRLLRTAAELQNIRTRHKKEIDDARKYSMSNFAQDMITVLENLRRAQESVSSENIDENAPLKTLLEGIDLTAEGLINTFEKHGVERISPLGEVFNHNFHQALVQIPTDEFEVGKVCQVMAAGYKIKDRLLRPAMVGVATAVPQVSEENTSEEATAVDTKDTDANTEKKA